jgi:tetratricopeptide (TPR) repeat protein
LILTINTVNKTNLIRNNNKTLGSRSWKNILRQLNLLDKLPHWVNKYFFCFAVFSIIACASFFYFCDTSIKANYYFKTAVSLDESNPDGSVVAIKYYNKAIKTYLGANNKDNAVKAYINLGLLHYKLGNILQVERAVLSALEYGKDNLSDEMQAKAYLLLASTLEPSKAKLYIEKSLVISKLHHMNSLMAEAYFLQGQTNEYKANFEEAEKSYLQAVAATENMSSIDRSFNAVNLYERLGELYSGGGDIDNAIKYYSQALSYRSMDERGFETANYMKIIGDLYQEKKNYAKACQMWHAAKDEYLFFGAVAPFSISASGVATCNFG